ncbi:Ubiquitin-like domain-containing CTD phosphatase 1 [Dissostichus eleginoides]|nr:Ubiquitin-like domain-containing CTD phosphatase 1 [Dissostichus eleginoides]
MHVVREILYAGVSGPRPVGWGGTGMIFFDNLDLEVQAKEGSGHLPGLGVAPAEHLPIPQLQEEVLAPPPENDDVVNDFDIEEEVIEVENREENLAKIARRVKDYKVEEMNPPREGKGLLVLDVDYTLFDHKSCAETGQELMRPYLHEFLTSAYEDYDIVIWSATRVFDDIGRNFLMNPQNGLKIRPFMKAHLNREKDRELYKLAQYLKEIAKLEDFSGLNHKHWERYLSKRQHH